MHHRRDRLLDDPRRRQPARSRSEDHAGAERLCQNEPVAGPQPTLAQELSRPRPSRHGKTEGELGALGAVAADQHGTRRLEHVEPTAQHVKKFLLDDVRARRRQGGDRQGGLGRAPHGVDVAERMGRRDPPEQIRVVDHGTEKIDGLQQRRRAGEGDQRGVVGAIEADHDSAARFRLQPLHHPAEHGSRNLRRATAAAHRVFSRLREHFRQFAIAAHPASVDPVLQPPQARAISREGAARGDGMLVPRTDQRQPSPLRHGAPRLLAGERASQVRGERPALPDRVDSCLLARMSNHRRHVAHRENLRISGRTQRFVDRDKAPRCQRQPGLGEPEGGARFGHPQRLVEFDPSAVGANQRAGFDAEDFAVGQNRDPALGEDPLEEAADPAVVRRQQPFAGDEGNLKCGLPQPGEPMLCREGELDSTGTAADYSEAEARHLPCVGKQRLPARGEVVDRLDRDRVLGGARDIVRARGRTNVDRQNVVADRRVGAAQHGALSRVEADCLVADQARAGEARKAAEIDVAFLKRVMPGDVARQHAGIGRLDVAGDERHAHPRRRPHAKALQYVDMGMTAPDEHKILSDRNWLLHCRHYAPAPPATPVTARRAPIRTKGAG